MINQKQESFWEKISVYHPLARNFIANLTLFLVGLPGYLLTNEFMYREGRPGIEMGFESQIPLLPWTVFIYYWIYVMVFTPIFFVRDLNLLKAGARAFLTGIIVCIACFIVIPMKMNRPVLSSAPGNFFDWWLYWNYTIDKPSALFPSMHVTNVFLVAFITLRFSKKVGIPSLLAAILISISTLTIKQHYFSDVIAGFVLAIISYTLFIKPFADSVKDVKKEEIILPAKYALYVPLIGITATFILYFIYRISLVL